MQKILESLHFCFLNLFTYIKKSDNFHEKWIWVEISLIFFWELSCATTQKNERKGLRIKSFDLQEPEYDHMVFINRREGLVPLSSLCKDDVKSVMSSNVKLLKGRNVRLGKPRIFVKDNGRLVAVGGSRGEIFIETTDYGH